MKAVKLAKEDQQATSTVIFTDSQSVRDSVENRKSDHPLIIKIFSILLDLINEGRRVEIRWVPAHVGIPQNERADEAAKEAAERDATTGGGSVHYKDYYPVIREKVGMEWAESWLNSGSKLRDLKDNVQPWKFSLQKSRRQEVALCRLRIGHTRLTHSWIIERGQQPVCQDCNVPVTVKHILAECDLHANLRYRIFPQTIDMDAQHVLKHMLGERNGQFGIDLLIKYLVEIGIYNDI